MGGTAEEIEQRLQRGEWLSPGDVATLLGVSKNTVIRMVEAKKIGHRVKPGVGRHRLCNPEDVRRELRLARGEDAG